MTSEVKKAVIEEIGSAKTLAELGALMKANQREDMKDDQEVAEATEEKKGELMEEEKKIDKSQLVQRLAELEALVVKLSKPKKRKVRARKGRKILVDRTIDLPAGVTTPQTRQLAAAFKLLGSEEMTEAEVFQMVEDAKAKGVMKTTQPAVRIYRYYREPLVAAGIIQQVN